MSGVVSCIQTGGLKNLTGAVQACEFIERGNIDKPQSMHDQSGIYWED
jgi:hypothetical protein